jgi:gas vesicle protein
MVLANREPIYNNNILGILAGILVGSLVGAVTMLLLAPQSGKDTRMQIRKKGTELSGRTSEMMEDTLAQVRLNRDKLTMGGRERAEELLHQGQALVVEQLDNVTDAVLAGKKVIQNA